jgi:hypothetical protein
VKRELSPKQRETLAKNAYEPGVSGNPGGVALTENSGETMAGRPANLKPWPKGTSGNPGGRPKTCPITTALRELLEQPVPGDKQNRTYAQRVALKMVERAIRGDVQAAREIANRVEGRVAERIAIREADFGGLFSFRHLSDEELEAEWNRTGEVLRRNKDLDSPG